MLFLEQSLLFLVVVFDLSHELTLVLKDRVLYECSFKFLSAVRPNLLSDLVNEEIRGRLLHLLMPFLQLIEAHGQSYGSCCRGGRLPSTLVLPYGILLVLALVSAEDLGDEEA